jgi:DNA repair protein RecO
MQRELYTRALVLDRRENDEADGSISFFTEEFGKVVAKARGIRKIKSKLSAHLQPLRFVKVRFARRSGRQEGLVLVDSVLDDDFLPYETNRRYDLLDVAHALDKIAFELQADRQLWFFLVAVFTHAYDLEETVRSFVRILGFDPDEARCFSCGASRVQGFVAREHGFACKKCSFKLPSNEVLYFHTG